MLGYCFVLHYLVSFPVLYFSRYERESRLLYFKCLTDVMWLLVFFNLCSWCCGSVKSV